MTAERWAQIKSLFEQALVFPAAERAGWVQANTTDLEVAAETIRLLQEHESADTSFLNQLTQEPGALMERAARVLAESIEEPPEPAGPLAGRYDLIRVLG